MSGNGSIPSAAELAAMTAADRARVLAQLNAATGGMVPDAIQAARAGAGEIRESGPVKTASELAAVQLAAASIPLKAAIPFGVGPSQVMEGAERAGLIRKPTAPAPSPDAPAEAAADPPFRQYSDQMADAAPKAPKGGGGGGRVGPFQDGTDQESRHEVAGRPVAPEAKEKYAQAFETQMRSVDQQSEAAQHESTAQEEFYRRQLGEQARIADAARALEQERRAKVQEFDDRVQARLTEENSDGVVLGKMAGQFLSGIGLALGAWAASTTGGPNHALAIYKQHVDERAADLARRSKDEDNLYSRMLRSFGDREQALAATRAALNDRGALELAKIGATAKTEYAKGAAEAMKAKVLELRGHNIDGMAAIEAPKIEASVARSRAHFLGGPPTSLAHPGEDQAAPPAPPPGPAAPAAPPPARDFASEAALRPAPAPDEGAERTLLRDKGGGWFPTSGQMDVAAHPDGKPTAPVSGPRAAHAGALPAQKYSGTAEGSVDLSGPATAGASPPPPAGRTAKEQAVAMARWDMIVLGRDHPEELKAAQAQLNKSEQEDHAKGGGLKSAIVAAKQADRAFPTGSSAAEVGNILRSAKYRAWDAARSLTTGKPASMEFAAAQAFGKAITPSFPPGTNAKEKQQLMAYWELKARVIRARAGANLGANEEKLYNDALGSDDVEKLRVALQVIKEDVAARWEERMQGYSKNTVRLLESYGTQTQLNPHERWVH